MDTWSVGIVNSRLHVFYSRLLVCKEDALSLAAYLSSPAFKMFGGGGGGGIPHPNILRLCSDAQANNVTFCIWLCV